MFEATNHDFESVARGSKVQHRFVFTNLYKEDVHISSVRSSCGCTTAEFTDRPLKTYEKGEVIATLNTRSYSGQRSATLTVTFDQPFYAEVQLLVTGFVRTDVVLDPPLQDIERLARDTRIKVIREPENLFFFLGMDQGRDELLYSDVKGRNPFKDRRVRLAMYQALDVNALNRVVMRGLAFPATVMLPNPEAAGIPRDLVKRYPHDVAAAKKLLAEAGYPRGFGVELDCQNVRETVCTAIAGMLARVDIRVKVNSLQNPRFFAKGQSMDTSFYLLGWGGSNTDASSQRGACSRFQGMRPSSSSYWNVTKTFVSGEAAFTRANASL